MSEPKRIAFAGTPEFAVPVLEALVGMGYEIPVVLTQPDRPAGRGRKLTASAVKQSARAWSLRLLQPASLRTPLAELGESPELLVVVAYGLLLPQWLLDWPRLACVNVHASLLPRWRGAAPIQRAIEAGDPRTGVSLMRMVTGLDAGPVYAFRETEIGAEETGGELHDRLAALGARLIEETLPSLLAGGLQGAPQDEAQATYASKIAKSEAVLDWRAPAASLARKVRAFNPWPVAESRLSDGRRLRIWTAAVANTETDAAPGTIVAATHESVDVATGDGVLRLTTLQPPGARPMAVGAYLAAHSLAGVSFAV